jgi:formylglycine-generating enzyme required for sulfatase activity
MHATPDLPLPAFVVVPAAPFLMGTPEAALGELARRYGGTRESYREEAPRHEVSLPAYAIARTPVTNALYAAFVAGVGAPAPLAWRGATPPAERLDHPVVDVSWNEAQAFCAPLAARGGPRLPTEAEWEHAARGGDGRAFPWGEAFAPHRANTRDGGPGATTPVGAYPAGASPYGVLDMAGNVWEWTASLDAPYPYRPDDGREDLMAPGRRIMRGGCYANPHGYARCACRFRLPPTARNEFTGFRLALSLAREGSTA